MANGLFLSNSQYTSPPIISILKLGWSPSTELEIPSIQPRRPQAADVNPAS